MEEWKQRLIDNAHETPKQNRDGSDHLIIEQADEIRKLRAALSEADVLNRRLVLRIGALRSALNDIYQESDVSDIHIQSIAQEALNRDN